jgi:lipopolysaccharide transport system ATP-binding protein
MLPETVIHVEKLSKLYTLGVRQQPYESLRESLMNSLIAPFKGLVHPNQKKREPEKIWALKDVSFDVQRGEVMGIIGRNGAGKSTLLKILSRITKPTAGRAVVSGRVGSLLEVGTGFHPELTGRENIFLNGTILGMHRKEIEGKFDEIVAFSEIEKFLDTPVKRYSSGMYVRLAFAVAAHLDTDILFVDEVLAVGDAAFQKKCLEKIHDVSVGGRTILLVSHNMRAISNLCEHAIWIDNGRVRDLGTAENIVDSYYQNIQRAKSLGDISEILDRLPVDPTIKLETITISQDGQINNVLRNNKGIQIDICYKVLQPVVGLRLYFDLLDEEQNLLIRTFHDENEDAIPAIKPGIYLSTAVIPRNLLASRTYEIRIGAIVHNVRNCTGEGVRIPLIVENMNRINRNYSHVTTKAKLQPEVDWSTIEISPN